LKYRAPEALAVNEAMTDMNGKIMNDDTGTDWFKVDMWSLGLIVYEMSTLGKAYKFESEEMYRSNLTSSKFWMPDMPEDTPEWISDMYDNLVSKDPQAWWSARGVLSHLEDVEIDDIDDLTPPKTFTYNLKEYKSFFLYLKQMILRPPKVFKDKRMLKGFKDI
jgi:serine/threonine protein kinase